jgi:ABC-type sugar transport system permease subunit
VGLTQRRPGRTAFPGHNPWTPWFFLAVPLIIYTLWVVGPMLYTFYLSLTNWDGISPPEFIGLKNYVRLFRDDVFFFP